jgi:hypothetical protein
LAVSLTVCRSAISAKTAKPASGRADRESAGNPLERANPPTRRTLIAVRKPAYKVMPEIPATKLLGALKKLGLCA